MGNPNSFGVPPNKGRKCTDYRGGGMGGRRERSYPEAMIRKSLCWAAPWLLGCVAAFGQTPDVHHHNLDVGIGPAIPTGSTTDFLGTAPLVGFHYGYRFNKLFQADAGFQLAWNAAGNNQNPVFTNVGEIQ